jgi:hypothetical protein
MPQNNIPNPGTIAGAPLDIFAAAPPGGYTAEGEAGLIDIVKDGATVAVTGTPRGGVTIDLLPTALPDPPKYIRVFGALYVRTESS